MEITLKGGEIMHIRHFIIMGIFLGAAAFLPNNVFAEKNGAAGQPEPQNRTIHTPVLEKIKNPRASEKAAPVAPKNVKKSHGGVVQKPVTNASTQKDVPIKPAPKSPNKTNRSIEKVVPSIEKKVKASEPAEPVAKMKEPGQTGRVKTTAVTTKLPEVPKSLPSNQTDSEVKTSGQPSGIEAKSETMIEETVPPVSLKTDNSPTIVQKPVNDAENKAPSNHRKNPEDIEIMINPPQRSQTSGGQSNEQFSPGAGSIIFTANLFDWDEYYGLNLRPIYTSRQAKYCHQWSNAPPSPPPKDGSFFLNV